MTVNDNKFSHSIRVSFNVAVENISAVELSNMYEKVHTILTSASSGPIEDHLRAIRAELGAALAQKILKAPLSSFPTPSDPTISPESLRSAPVGELP